MASSPEIKEEHPPSTPTEKQLKELEMFVQKQFQMPMEASSSSVVVVAAKEPQPTIKTDEPQPRISRRPRNSRFLQQELPGSRPVLTSRWVLSISTFMVLICIPIGIAALIASNNVVEVTLRYDDVCVPLTYLDDAIAFIKDDKIDKTCIKKLIIEKKMKAPIFVYYELHNFYQNHRRYVQSRSDKQLRTHASEMDVKSCSPMDRTGNDQPIVPCGLVAWSIFNDTYKVSKNNKDLPINKKGIAWKSDKEKFGSDVYPKNFQTGGLIGGGKLDEKIPLSEQEDLMVWMRTAAFPKFRKLYGRIEDDLEAKDEIEIAIENNYNSYQFKGKKVVVLSTTTWIGGKNRFLGIAYIGLGVFFLLFSVVYGFACVMIPEPHWRKEMIHHTQAKL